MNPQFVAASYTHTISEKLTEYFIEPLTSFFIVLILVIMFANVYMFRKLRKLRERDYIEVTNLLTLGIYVAAGIISAFIVSRLGPHGVFAADNCDKKYMVFPRIIFIIVAIINVIYFVINIITKLKKNKEDKETEERSYFAEEKIKETVEEQENLHKKIDVISFVDNIKDKIDIEGIKDKVNNITEEIKDIVNSKIKKDE